MSAPNQITSNRLGTAVRTGREILWSGLATPESSLKKLFANFGTAVRAVDTDVTKLPTGTCGAARAVSGERACTNSRAAVGVECTADTDGTARGRSTRAVVADTGAALRGIGTVGTGRPARALLFTFPDEDVVAVATLPARRVVLLRAAAPSRRHTSLRLGLLGQGGVAESDRGQQRCAERPADERAPREAPR
jgi:hypothetical protein